MAKRYEKARKYTEKYKGKLAPCKYCGNTDIRIWTDREIFGSRCYWTVNCMTRNCDFTEDFSIRTAVKHWNERHAPGRPLKADGSLAE